MAAELRMPALGMTMEEGRVVAWRAKEGDEVARGQILLDIESEKVAYEMESPADGVVGRILVPADGVVPVGTLLVSILAPGEVSAAPARAGGEPMEMRRRLSPRARKLAESLGVDLSILVGTGPGGIIVEEDIRSAAARRAARARAPRQTPFVLRPLTSMRRTIADRMAESARSAPHFFLAVEVDGSAFLGYRASHGSRLEAETGIKLTLTDLLLHVTARTLVAHRSLNASYTAEGVREWEEVNLGLAVAVDDGLVVPVVHGADRRPLGELMTARADLVGRARSRALRRDDLQGGTFTLSNLGAFGVDFFTSILNPSQAGILSVGTLSERPAVVGGAVVARPTMLIGLTIDHRVTDGVAGSRFLAELRARIEAAALDG